ncbi:hypothetical protein FNV43_RR26343 [Rhamnella rubrinervis]|uniref:SBP-type domain-containing protein n=1 Tax=Rhamnella rubrinervis TaxID=2594499 RepID=A0A8K0DIE6_9ROSA|nr:hypothetical protein FNV43_RR26343 [Rhamnella rubrinervis]
MELWNLASEGKSLLFSDELDWSDALARSRKALIQCDNGFVSSREPAESMELMELGFPDMLRRPFHGSQGLEILCGGVANNGSISRVSSPTCLITSNSSLGEDESGSKLSSPFMESNSQDSSLIDLKLGRLIDCKTSQNHGHSSEKPVLSSIRPSLLAKRSRSRGSYSQTPFCQVHGCNMDLSSSKDYHKRHKVCDTHSKTAKVIVNGIEQRFCQQCSRFHLLAEFDDGKRSCRRRLAGHNERRRKPQLDSLSEKSHKLFQSYQGTRYLSTLPKRTPYVFSDILPSAIQYPEKYEQANQYGHLRLEAEPLCSPQLTIPLTNRQLPSKCFTHLHNIGKQHASGVSSSGTEDYDFDTASTVQKPSRSGPSNSTCALSLLSAQSQNLSYPSAGVPSASPLMLQGSHHSIAQLSDKSLRVRPAEKYGPNGFYSCGRNSMGVNQLEAILLPEANHAVDLEVHANRVFQDSDCLDAKYCLSPENGSTVDLLQLSSHLQRVERQRNFTQVKQENEEFCCFPTA